MSDEQVWRHVVAGAAAGWMTSLITCPLDVVKTRLQLSSSSSHVNKNTLKSLLSIWRREGLHGMYRGLTPTLIGYLPAFSIYFPTYHFCKSHFATYRHTNPATDPVSHVGAAMSAGLVGNLFTNPLWVVRTRLMTQHVMGDRLYEGTLDAFRCIAREEGWRGFYKGIAASMVGVLHVAVQFPLYEWLKSNLGNSNTNSDGQVGMGNVLLASTISKVIASTATYPHEVVRTRLQAQRLHYSSVSDAIVKIWREDGFRGFYRGLSTNVIRVIPASAVTFITFEFILQHLL